MVLLVIFVFFWWVGCWKLYSVVFWLVGWVICLKDVRVDVLILRMLVWLFGMYVRIVIFVLNIGGYVCLFWIGFLMIFDVLL